MATLAVDGDRRVYYERYRNGGRTVVLVHGWGMSCRAWDTTLPALLDRGHEVVALDLRCCGASDKDFDDVRVAVIASDLVRLVDELGLEGPVLNGWSLGGVVCVRAAAELGVRLGGLVLTSAPTPRFTATEGWPWGRSEADVEEMIGQLRSDRAAKLREIAAANFHAPVDPAVIDWMWQVFLQMSPRAYETMRDLVALEQRELLSGIEVPVLVLAGRHDAFVQFEAMARSAEVPPHGRLVEFAESGHAPFLEQGELYRRELVDFVDAL